MTVAINTVVNMATYPLMLLKSDFNPSFDKSILINVKGFNRLSIFLKIIQRIKSFAMFVNPDLTLNYLIWALS